MSNPFIAKPSSGGDIPDAIEAGNYPAVLVALVDLGTQESDYNGVTSYRHEIVMAWEVHAEDRVVVMAKQFALSLTPKSNLGKLIAALSQSGKVPEGEVDLTKLLGKPCLIQVSSSTKKTDSGETRTYNAAETVSKLPKGMAAPKPKREPVTVTLDDDVPEWLPRVYGTTLSDLRGESAEKNSRTAAKAEEWKKNGKKQRQKSGQPAGGGHDGGYPGGDFHGDDSGDEIPF